jgi:ferrous iron transport protein B
MTPSMPQTIVLVGLESVGKSALFRQLTGEATGDEANFRGSTVRVRTGQLRAGDRQLIDTPGIRGAEDSLTTRLALQQVAQADRVLLIARGTHIRQEVEKLLSELGSSLHGRRLALAITFADKAAATLPQTATHYARTLGIPVAVINARMLDAQQHSHLLQVLDQATPFPHRVPLALLPTPPIVQPRRTWFEHRHWGPWLALATMALLFALPIYLAYQFANWLQPLADVTVITPLVNLLTPLATWWPLGYTILAGDYGLLTLGWYSFLWAFPVVLLISISVAIGDETGLKDRITAALDPSLRVVGLNGRDLVPVLSGFGCNVVAVLQSRACSSCTRTSCISLIAFGSACSYQIGASLSLFNSAGSPWLFAPYLAVLFVVGAIHTRVWQRGRSPAAAPPLAERAFFQRPTWRGMWWRVRTVLRQFLYEALPIFFTICAAGALLAHFGVMTWLAGTVAPALGLFGLPGAVAPGVIFSILRKDGLLALNQGDGALLATLTAGQVFVLVYLASTLTACLVTLWTVRQELGWRMALLLAGRQMVTSVVSTLALAWVVA